MPAIATLSSIFVIPSLHTVLMTVQPYGRCEETMRAPSFATVSAAKAAAEDLNGLRTVDAGGVGSSSRVSAHSGASLATCKDLMALFPYSASGPSILDWRCAPTRSSE